MVVFADGVVELHLALAQLGVQSQTFHLRLVLGLLVLDVLLDFGLDLLQLVLSRFVVVFQNEQPLPLVLEVLGVIVAVHLQPLHLGHWPFLRLLLHPTTN